MLGDILMDFLFLHLMDLLNADSVWMDSEERLMLARCGEWVAAVFVGTVMVGRVAE
jgi:hypothetical protein